MVDHDEAPEATRASNEDTGEHSKDKPNKGALLHRRWTGRILSLGAAEVRASGPSARLTAFGLPYTPHSRSPDSVHLGFEVLTLRVKTRALVEPSFGAIPVASVPVSRLTSSALQPGGVETEGLGIPECRAASALNRRAETRPLSALVAYPTNRRPPSSRSHYPRGNSWPLLAMTERPCVGNFRKRRKVREHGAPWTVSRIVL
jgi:hypothetical protein